MEQSPYHHLNYNWDHLFLCSDVLTMHSNLIQSICITRTPSYLFLPPYLPSCPAVSCPHASSPHSTSPHSTLESSQELTTLCSLLYASLHFRISWEPGPLSDYSPHWVFNGCFKHFVEETWLFLRASAQYFSEVGNFTPEGYLSEYMFACHI